MRFIALRNKMKFSIRTLLLWTLLVSAFFPFSTLYTTFTSRVLRESHPQYHDFVVSSVLREGDAFEKVSAKYNTLRLIQKTDPQYQHFRWVAKQNNWIIRDTDEFFGYSFEGEEIVGYHQFRDGMLVNHPADSFRNPYQNAVTNNFQVPHWSLRSGVWPPYLLTAIAFLIAWSVFNRNFKKRDNKSLD